MKVRKAIIPAAGLGTRFLPVTKSIPKEMLPLIDKPILQFIIEEIVESGIDQILIVTTRNKETIENHFDRNLEYEVLLKHVGKLDEYEEIKEISELANIYYIRQGQPEGLGHAVGICRDFIGDEPFALLLGDEVFFSKKPALKQMIDIHEKTQASVLCVGQVDHKDVSKYGIVELEEEMDKDCPRVKTMVEKPNPEDTDSSIAIYGRYILKPSIFNYIDQIQPGKGGEYQLTDALELMLKDEDICVAEVEGQRFDVGSKIGYIKASLYLALNNEEYRDEVLEFIEQIEEKNL